LTYIYALRDETGIRYVGKADVPVERARQHWNGKNQYKTIKNSWLKSLAGPPTVQILQEVEDHEWQAAETDWILQLRDYGCRLTNGTNGGDGGAVTDPDARARTRAAHVGKVASEETRRKMSEAQKRRLEDPAEREKLRKTALKIGLKPPPPLTGEASNLAKFSDAAVVDIRMRHCNGETLKQLAERFATSKTYISLVVTGKTRKDAGGPTREATSRGGYKGNKRSLL